MNDNRTHAAVFLDRDGVINEERGYVHQPDDFILLPGVVASLLKLGQAGFRLVVITNQAGIARGYYGEEEYAALLAHIRGLLAANGVTVAGFYHCPHHPEHGRGRYKVRCACRKPEPGMILRARDELGLDLGRSFLVGDKRSDIQAGVAAGVGQNILVQSGHPVTEADQRLADICLPGLPEAADWIIARTEKMTDRNEA